MAYQSFGGYHFFIESFTSKISDQIVKIIITAFMTDTAIKIVMLNIKFLKNYNIHNPN